MLKIRVQTIDGDVDYFDLAPKFYVVCGAFLMVNDQFICSMFYPEYRLSDLIITFCEV